VENRNRNGFRHHSLDFILWVIPSVTLVVGYFLGLRSQKTQSLHEYVISTVKEQYPSLFSEMQRNSEYLDNFLEKPIVGFQFPVLTKFLRRGLGSLMKKHHANLFQSVIYFADRIQPKFEELNRLRTGILNSLYKIWQPYMHERLLGAYPEYVSEGISSDLIRSDNPHNVLSELLSKKYDLMAQKVEKCYFVHTKEIREQEARRRNGIRGIPVGDVDFQSVTKSLVELATPTVENILKVYAYLKEQNDVEIKERLLPLLQKYISNPV